MRILGDDGRLRYGQYANVFGPRVAGEGQRSSPWIPGVDLLTLFCDVEPLRAIWVIIPAAEEFTEDRVVSALSVNKTQRG
jgi:hypothetical protein